MNYLPLSCGTSLKLKMPLISIPRSKTIRSLIYLNVGITTAYYLSAGPWRLAMRQIGVVS